MQVHFIYSLIRLRIIQKRLRLEVLHGTEQHLFKIKIMATYRIEPFGIELINPTIVNVTPTYTVGGAFVEVYASLKVDGMNPKSVYMGQMKNTDTWGDDEVLQFATEKLETFKI